MKDLSPIVQNILYEEYYNAFLLLALNFRGNIFRYSTLNYDVEIDNNLYSPDHGIISLEPPKVGTSLVKDSYTIKIADPSFVFKQYVSNSVGSAYMELLAGFMNTAETSIQSSSNKTFQPGQPILDSQDFVTVYKGIVDSLQYIMSEDEGIILEIKTTSPMGILDSSNVFYLTPQLLQRRANGDYDTAFDNVSIAGTIEEIKWGKVP